MSHEKLDLILSKLQSMENKMEGFKTQLDENVQITKAIHHRQEETDAKLEGLSINFAKLHGEVVANRESIDEIKDNQKTIADVVNQMADIQEQQASTINLLARRSLDQEDKIRRIK